MSSKLTLEVSRNDDNSYITCAVDHATLTSGNKKSAQALRVLCESNREGVGALEEAGATNGERKTLSVLCVFLGLVTFLFGAVHIFRFKLRLSGFIFATCDKYLHRMISVIC